MIKYFIAALLISVACTQVTNKKTSANKDIEAIEFPVADTLTLLFGGDAMQHLPQINSARTIIHPVWLQPKTSYPKLIFQ